jgi:cell division septal protein FtsQ
VFAKRRRIKRNTARKTRPAIIFVVVILVLVIIGGLIWVNNSFGYGKAKYISPIAAGKSSQISEVTLLEDALKNQNILYTSVARGQEDSLLILLKDNGEVILSSKKDLRSQVTSLQLMLSRLTIEGKKLKVLDLRYNHPVISF